MLKKIPLASIFARILLMMLVAGFLVNGIVFFFFKRAFSHDEHVDQLARQNIQNYIDYVVKELQEDGEASVKNVAQEIGLAIRWERGSEVFGSEPGLPAIVDLRESGWKRDDRRYKRGPLRHFPFIVGLHEGRPFGIVPTEEGDVAILGTRKLPIEFREEFLVFLIGGLSLVLVGVYFGLNRLLAPIRHLRVGVSQVMQGEFGRPVPVVGKGELKDLTHQFNEMSVKIKSMMMEKQQLLYDVSHELRSPITRMNVAMEMMEETPYRTAVKEDLREMESMISEILEAAQLASGPSTLERTNVDLRGVLEGMKHQFEGRGPEIRLNLPPSFKVYCHLDKTKVVLRNILENAIKYSDPEGAAIEIFSPHAAELCIEDHGPGIPEEELSKVFEPFYRVDKSRQKSSGGYGLGLHLCQRIMEKQGGTISLTSVLGQGSRVTLTFSGS